MENLMLSLTDKVHREELSADDFQAITIKLWQIKTRHNYFSDLINDFNTEHTQESLIKIVKYERLYESLLEYGVHVGLFAATAFIHYKYYFNADIPIVLPDVRTMLHDEGQDAFNYLLHEILKAEVDK